MLETPFIQSQLFRGAPSSSEPSSTPNNLPSENNSPDDSDEHNRSTERHLNNIIPVYSGEEELESEQFTNQSYSDDNRLDESSLGTVLDMLAVIDTVEELSLLETLTETQKRQVWDATPDPIRTKLKQLRASAQTNSPASSAELHLEPIDETSQDKFAELDEWDDAESIDGSIDLNLNFPQYTTGQPTLHPQDWVVLHAHPKLSAAELNAIWEVVEVHQTVARIYAKSIGTRNYPIVWMKRYPKPNFD
jgi:hypothetical protein